MLGGASQDQARIAGAGSSPVPDEPEASQGTRARAGCLRGESFPAGFDEPAARLSRPLLRPRGGRGAGPLAERLSGFRGMLLRIPPPLGADRILPPACDWLASSC